MDNDPCNPSQSDTVEPDPHPTDDLFELLRNLTEQEYCFLIRTALSSRSESELPTSRAGYFLSRMAGDAGMDIGSLEQDQQKKIQSRQRSQTERIQTLEKKIAELETL